MKYLLIVATLASVLGIGIVVYSMNMSLKGKNDTMPITNAVTKSDVKDQKGESPIEDTATTTTDSKVEAGTSDEDFAKLQKDLDELDSDGFSLPDL